MLQNIRDSSQGIVAKIIIGFIIALMAMFGIETIFSQLGTNTSVAEVNGVEITEPQLTASVQNLMASIGSNLQDMDENLLREIALGQIVDDMVLMQSADNAGMVVSDASLDRAIIDTPQFQIDGTFDRDLALRTMGAQGFTPASYRATLADRMLISQLANAYASTSFITDAELEQIATLTLQTRDFRYLSVTLGTRTLGEPIPPEDIEAYYQNNEDQFMREEEVAINYVVLQKSALFDAVELDEERVRAEYETQRDNFTASAERRASHILLESEDEAAAIAQAQDIKTRLDAGEDFAALADEFSVDRASAEEGGDIGYSDGSAFPEAVEQALLELEVGETSEPVVSEFGVHLVKLTEFEQSDYPPFEEVAERIERDLKSAEVDQLYFQQLETLANLAFETPDLQEISETLGLEIRESDFFTRSGGTDQYTSDPQVIETAFADEILIDGNNSDVVEFDTEEAMVLRVREHNEAQLRPLDEVRGEIAAILRGELERERAQQLGEQILSALQAGQPVEELLAESELEWFTAEDISRNEPGVNSEIVRAAFNIPQPEGQDPVYQGTSLNNGTYIVIELNEVTPGSLAEMSEEEVATLKSSIIERSGRSTFDSYLSNLRSSAEIEQNI